MFLSVLPMIFRKVYLSFENLGYWRRKWADVSISLPQLHIGLGKSWNLCLNLCSRRWLKPNLDLVNNLTPLGLWQLKTVLPEGRMKFKSVFLKIFKLSKLQIFGSSLFHLITAEEKKEFRKKLCFTLSRGILVFLVLYVLTEVGIILNRYFGHLCNPCLSFFLTEIHFREFNILKDIIGVRLTSVFRPFILGHSNKLKQ